MSISLTRPISILLVAILGVSLNSCSASHPETIAITHVTVIDATGEASKADFTVITQGQRISAVGPSSSTPIPNSAKIVDGSGKFLIPGLADMHIHLTGAGEPTGSREFIIPLLIANGITTVRDMGGKIEYLKALRQEINSGKRAGPQIFFTGPYLDGNPPSFQPSVVVQNAAEAVAAVQTLKREGVDFIKVQSRLQPEAYYAIAEESKKQGIRFVGHVPDSITVVAASDAGQASIEHLTGILLGCSSREEELRQRQLVPLSPGEPKEQAVARERKWNQDLLASFSQQRALSLSQKFVMNQTWQVPTLPLLVHLGYLVPETDRIGDSRLEYIPRAVRETWDSTRKALLESRTEIDFDQRRHLIKESMQAVKAMNDSGVAFMAGTDAAAPNVFPGFSLHEDLEFLVEAGLTPLQALQAATSNPAEFLHRSAEQGTIQAGKRADLVLLEANPLQDIRNAQKIRSVILNGHLFERSDLDSLLAEAEQFASAH